MTKDPGKEQRDQDIATLLRIAGRRRSVPEARSARVKAAVEAQWLEEVGKSRRRRRVRVAVWLTAAASLLIAVIAVQQGRLGVPMLDEIAVATIERIEGDVWQGDGPDAGQPLRAGDALPLQATLTTSESGRIALRLPSGHSVRVDRASQLRIVAPARLALERGAVYIDSAGHDPRQSSLLVESRFGEVRELGTQYEVRLNELSVHVRLREGAVWVAHDGVLDEVMAGTEYELFADGRSSTGPIAPDSPLWDWTAAIRPAFDLEGRTAQEFLNWISRERGLRLVFDEPQTALTARSTQLKGSARSLTADESLDDVLATCGMHYRVEGGTLVVFSLSGGGTPAK